MDKKGLFVRPASGLVREVSTSRAFFFNVGASVTWTPAYIPSYLAFAPAWLILGWSSLSWGTLVVGLFAIFALAPINMYLATALPRSGGEQVYTPRITHPFIGFVETWTFVFSIFAMMGYGLYVMILLLRNALTIIGFTAAQPWNSYATWFDGTTGILVSGTLIMAFVLIASMQPPRRFHTINTAIVALGLVLTALIVPFMFGIDPATFARNFQAFTGQSVQDVNNLVASQGFSVGTFAIATLGLVLGTGLSEFVGFQFSGFLAGELKGKVSRNILYSMVGAGIVIILLNTVFVQVFINILGYDFIAGLSYLFWNAPASAPIIPTAQTFVAIAKPEVATLMAISLLGSFLIGLSLFITWIATATRTAFAWGMDRLIPTKLSEINPRTRSPLYLVIMFTALWYGTFLGSVYGVTFLAGVLTSWLLAMFVWIIPGINAVLLPYRRRDLYDLIPQSMRRKFGIPLVSIFGIAWLVFIIPLYILYVIWPLVAGAYGEHLAAYITFALSQGLVHFTVITVAGVAIYFASRWYNRRRGIDVDMLFKTVPPE